MAASHETIRPGNILELEGPSGFSYIQYVGKHSEYGDVVRVVPKCHTQAIDNFVALISEPGYLAFYSARRAVSSGLAKVVARLSLPDNLAVPRSLRRAGARSRSGEILTWILEIDGAETVTELLTDAERTLPIAAVWDHELLLQRISEHWLPQTARN